MYCPKCGVENPDSAEKCSSCGCVLTTVSKKEVSPHHRRSVPAVASFVLAIFSVGFILGGWGGLGLLFSIVLSILAIIFGITSLVKITKSARPLKGKGFAIAGIVIPIVHYGIVITFGTIMVRSHSMYVRQGAQFQSIDMALTAFRQDYGDYPPSGAQDEVGQHYGGAQKLAEALFGKDLMGFHLTSKFRRDGTNGSANSLYVPATAKTRRGPYLSLEKANVYRLKDVYEDVGPFDGNSFVICDVCTKKRHSGKKTGMPILYYRANISSKTMDYGEPMDKRIYNAEDNLAIVQLARTRGGGAHPLADNSGKFFYDKGYKIIDLSITSRDWPHNADSYILISAGKDGLYGTSDDVANFAR